MRISVSAPPGHRGGWSVLALLSVLPWLQPQHCSAESGEVPVVPKWTRFEHTFKSSVGYTNPVQGATLEVRFVSPLGRTNLVYGFWDGGKTWRVRFSPDLPGQWTYHTTCSDPSNLGLNDQSGELLCSAVLGQLPFHLHGPVRVAFDAHHFEQADGLPFFWLADTTWNGARLATERDWLRYALNRVDQKFNVIQWAATPGADPHNQLGFSGEDQIWMNPEYFQRLDAKVEALNRVGLVSAIVPILETDQPASDRLPESQAALLLRYLAARWGGDTVVWVLMVPPDRTAKSLERWRNIGRLAFGETRHAPVIVFAQDTASLFDQFRSENWVGAFAYPIAEEQAARGFSELADGPVGHEWAKSPAHPLIPVLPGENRADILSDKTPTADELRRLAFSSLLLAPPAGLTYSAQGVLSWDETYLPLEASGHGFPAALPTWELGIFMPGAQQLGQLGEVMKGLEFWRMAPDPKLIASQPGAVAARRFAPAEATETRNQALVYIPETRSIDLSLGEMPPSASPAWLNPRTGETTPAAAVVAGNTAQFPTPDKGDWLLILKTGPGR